MIKEFKTFIAVARDGTFTGAGAQLSLTQSAVSAQIRRLEDYLGVELFDRGARAAVLNVHGREMLPQAEELVAMAERMASAGGAGHVSGSLRIGAIASVQQDLLVRALGLFRAQYPDVRVRIVPGVSLSLLGQVDAGEVDLAVLIRPPSRCRRNWAGSHCCPSRWRWPCPPPCPRRRGANCWPRSPSSATTARPSAAAWWICS